MNIYTSFLECANRWIDRPAMEHQMEDGSVRKFDYRQTIAWVESYADELSKYGIKAGSRVAIIAEACPEWNVAYYAIAKFEATSVLLDPSLPQPELLRLIEFAEVDALIVNSGVYAKLTDLEKVTTAPVLDLMDGLKHLSGKVLEQPHVTPGNPEVAFIIFSSGTTRVACGIMHGHDQIINTALSTIRSNGLNETDRYMAILPNSHIYGTLTQIFGPYLTGANVRFVQSLTAPALVQCFSEHHPTIIPGVPKLYELLENAARRKIASSAKTQKLFNFFFPICLNLRRKFNINLGKKLFGSVQNALGGEVKLMVSAGAPMRKDTADFYFATGFPLMITYGSTETNVPVTGNRAGHYTTDTCGRPYPDIQLSFSDSGEVLIKSPYQMLGYFKDEKATKAAFDENGWLLSGTFAFTPMHQCGHVLSAKYNATHGATLCCMMIAWMRYFVNRPDNAKYVKLAQNVFGCGLAEAADKLEKMAIEKGVQTKISQFGVTEAALEEITDMVVSVSFGPDGKLNGHPKMTREDILACFKLSM